MGEKTLQVIVCQAALEAKKMERLAAMTKGLEVWKLIIFKSALAADAAPAGAPTLTHLLKEFDASYVKLLISKKETERRLKDVLWEPSIGTTLREVPGLGLNRLVIVFGPDGDFTPDEINKAKAAGYLTVGLGSLNLPAEERAFYTLSCIHSLLC